MVLVCGIQVCSVYGWVLRVSGVGFYGDCALCALVGLVSWDNVLVVLDLRLVLRLLAILR